METGNVQSQLAITLVGNGLFHADDLGESVARAPVIVAADGGANRCVSAGHLPSFVIGDLDSVTAETRASLPEAKFIEIAEQETTDFEKCLVRVEAPFILAVGFTGGRLDHAMTALSVLARRVGPPTVLMSSEDIVFAAPTHLSLDVAPGTRISLFPMFPVTGSSKGLLWPIDDLKLAPDGQLSTSNEATGPVQVAFDHPGCLMIMPRSCLDAVLQGLTG